jgi:hypothetical protein
MPYAKIKTTQATLTLVQLHAELGGKILDNKREANRLRLAMKHVEAVLKLLDPISAYGPSPSAGGSRTRGSPAARSYAMRWTRYARPTKPLRRVRSRKAC